MKRLKQGEWEAFKEKNNLTFNKMSRIIFPFGLELPRKEAKIKERYKIEDEENLSLE